jgi:CRP-like cAMP-binding protein
MPTLTKNRTSSPDKTALSDIFTYLNSFHPIPVDSAGYIGKQLVERHLKKGELLQKSDVVCQYVYFVAKGILRGYIVDNNKRVTTWITCENQLVSSIRSLLLQVPTPENIEALEDCHLFALHFTDLQYLYDTYPEWNTLGRKIAEYYYTFAEERAFICRLSKATDRYNYFMASNGHLINRIPQMYIASYLGMTVENLSRIRKRLTKSKK